MSLLINFYPTALLLAVIVGFGIWVNRGGKPYHSLLFNIHKLAALGAVILTAVRFFRLGPLNNFPAVVLLLVGIAVLAAVGLFASGAVMSILSDVKPVLQWIHGILMAVAIGSFAAGLLLLGSG